MPRDPERAVSADNASDGTAVARLLGRRSALAVTIVGAAYLVVLATAMLRVGLSTPISDPILAVMEVLTIASALPLLGVAAALYVIMAPAQKTTGVLLLSLTTLFAGTTCAVHFLELTVGRQRGVGGLVWPSVPYAAELLAWDVFLGMALLVAARGLPATAESRTTRVALQLAGYLCLAGTVGPLIGRMRWQLIGVAGYALVLPVAMLLLARWFGASSRGAALGRSSQ